MRARFWGVRGSIPTSGKATLKYGGNTSCVEVRLSAGDLIIFDSGTGIRNLGRALMKEKKPIVGHIFLSHAHMDHVNGFPFFGPAYMKANRFIVRGCPPPGHTMKHALDNQMGDVYFPVEFNGLSANIEFEETCIRYARVGNARVTTNHNNHPGTSMAYRVQGSKGALVYMTDNELRSEAKDAYPFEQFVDFCEGADALIHDTQYTSKEYETWTKGWGHSRYTDVAELAAKAGVKKLVLFHHDPDHSDAFLEGILERTQALVRKMGGRAVCSLAREGRTLAV